MEDNQKTILIDYEYGDFNPALYDVGNYLNEYSCDNAYPRGTGTKYYLDNCPTEDDIAFAANKFNKKMNYTQFSRTINSSLNVINYNYATFDRSITDMEGTSNSLTPTETTTLAGQKFFYTLANGRLLNS